MTFSSIMFYLAIAYVVYYGGMISYEAFLKPAPSAPKAAHEEDVDISDIAADFQPVEISKDAPAKTAAQSAPGTMTGAMTAAQLVAEAEKLAADPRRSILARISDCWSVQGMSPATA